MIEKVRVALVYDISTTNRSFVLPVARWWLHDVVDQLRHDGWPTTAVRVDVDGEERQP